MKKKDGDFMINILTSNAGYELFDNVKDITGELIGENKKIVSKVLTDTINASSQKDFLVLKELFYEKHNKKFFDSILDECKKNQMLCEIVTNIPLYLPAYDRNQPAEIYQKEFQIPSQKFISKLIAEGNLSNKTIKNLLSYFDLTEMDFKQLFSDHLASYIVEDMCNEYLSDLQNSQIGITYQAPNCPFSRSAMKYIIDNHLADTHYKPLMFIENIAELNDMYDKNPNNENVVQSLINSFINQNANVAIAIYSDLCDIKNRIFHENDIDIYSLYFPPKEICDNIFKSLNSQLADAPDSSEIKMIVNRADLFLKNGIVSEKGISEFLVLLSEHDANNNIHFNIVPFLTVCMSLKRCNSLELEHKTVNLFVDFLKHTDIRIPIETINDFATAYNANSISSPRPSLVVKLLNTINKEYNVSYDMLLNFFLRHQATPSFERDVLETKDSDLLKSFYIDSDMTNIFLPSNKNERLKQQFDSLEITDKKLKEDIDVALYLKSTIYNKTVKLPKGTLGEIARFITSSANVKNPPKSSNISNLYIMANNEKGIARLNTIKDALREIQENKTIKINKRYKNNIEYLIDNINVAIENARQHMLNPFLKMHLLINV